MTLLDTNKACVPTPSASHRHKPREEYLGYLPAVEEMTENGACRSAPWISQMRH